MGWWVWRTRAAEKPGKFLGRRRWLQRQGPSGCLDSPVRIVERWEGMADFECVHTVQAQPLDRATKADCLAGMSLLSGLVYARETVAAIFFEESLMDMIRESPVAQYLTQQGIEQGGRERAIEALLDVLEIRFALGAADPLAARVRGIEDLQRLKPLHRAAIQVESLEAFQSLLDADE